MPVKWTPETDQTLLLKILETSDVAPKCAEIAEKWPTGQERPTPRAISERICKIRALAKASGTTGHFSVSSIKKRTPKKINGAKPAAGKRKRGGRMSGEEASDDSEPGGFKSDGPDISDDEAPKKKAKVKSTAKSTGKSKGPVKVEIEEEEEESGNFHDSGYENLFGGEGATEMVDYA